MSNGYNGWKNAETFGVAVWLDGQGEQRVKLARQAWADAQRTSYGSLGRMDRFHGSQNRIGRARHLLADSLGSWIGGLNPLPSDDSLFGSLMTAALANVDWQDIAEFVLDTERDLAAEIEAV